MQMMGIASLHPSALKESVDLSIGVFGQSFVGGEPQRLMQGFVNRKR